MNDVVKLNDLKSEITNLYDFRKKCEEKIFNWEEVKDLHLDMITEYYKLAVNVFSNDMKLYKELTQKEMDNPQTEMIVMLASDLNKEEKAELIDFLIKLKKKKEEK